MALVKHLQVGPLQCNMTLIADTETKRAIVVDPGGNADEILALADSLGVKIVQIAITHGHFDHCLAAEEVRRQCQAPVCIGVGDMVLLSQLTKQCQTFGFPTPAGEVPLESIVGLQHGDDLMVLDGKVLHTPGHSPGSCSFYFGSLGLVLTGDTLFQAGVGRTDLWGGNFNQLKTSIQEQLYRLPEHTKVIPGHGPFSTIKAEKNYNPFVPSASVPLSVTAPVKAKL